jgi:hypothetical protein
MNTFGQFGSIPVDELRKRLRKMNDIELVRFCRVCSQQLNMGETSSPTLIELEEAEAEWHRRQQHWLAQQ